AVDVFGHEDRRRGVPARYEAETGLLAEPRALVVVHLLEAGRPRLREDPEPEPRGPARRGGGAAAVHERRPARRRRAGRDAHGPAVVRELLAGPRLLQHGEALLHPAAALAERLPEHRVLLGPVAEPRDVGDAASTQDVEHRHVLGEANRV